MTELVANEQIISANELIISVSEQQITIVFPDPLSARMMFYIVYCAN